MPARGMLLTEKVLHAALLVSDDHCCLIACEVLELLLPLWGGLECNACSGRREYNPDVGLCALAERRKAAELCHELFFEGFYLPSLWQREAMKLFGLPDGMAYHRRGWQSSYFWPESLPIFPAMPSLLMLSLRIRPSLVVLEAIERSCIVIIGHAALRRNLSPRSPRMKAACAGVPVA